MTIEKAREIMAKNFIGVDELSRLGLFKIPDEVEIPKVPFSEDDLNDRKDDYLLILGLGELSEDKPVTIRNLIDIFGKDPDIKEPCFYNQDWYDKESFIDVPMKCEWFFIKKKVYEDSRALLPEKLMEKYSFPPAVRCTYAFFVTKLALKETLWEHDFVWCSDLDHNGDRIYVGKYNDVDGVNKNGFSIHRHLSLRPCYGCVD